jgi:protein-L-isoaspartate(D-aspartate) O-methyltransferase
VTTAAEDLDIVRRAYAKQVMAAAGVDNARVEAAFAAVRREDFLGPGPWPILRSMRGYVTSPSDDPVYLYTDDAIGILPERDLNNGQGEHVVHVGAGVGYYTVIPAELVRSSGAVTAIEFDHWLAERAAANLSRFPNAAAF